MTCDVIAYDILHFCDVIGCVIITCEVTMCDAITCDVIIVKFEIRKCRNHPAKLEDSMKFGILVHF